MDLFNSKKVADLEAEVKIYKDRNKQLEEYESRCKAAELRVKCMKMYIDDDEAIDEILSAMKSKQDIEINQRYRVRSAAQAQHAQSMALGRAGGHLGGFGGIGQLSALGSGLFPFQ